MLPRAQRLTRAKDFRLLAIKGRPIFGPFLTLRVRQTAEEKPRVAFITSTKVMKLSVDRNRAKRRLRHILRELMPIIPPRTHLVFILKPDVLHAKHPQLVDEVKRLLGKIPDALTKPAKLSPSAVKKQEKDRAKRAAASKEPGA